MDNVRFNYAGSHGSLGTWYIRRGRSIDGLCQHMDIGPAILELAGVDVPESFEAKSISGIPKGRFLGIEGICFC